ncbi:MULTISPECIES: hypothetical protein [unclassified Acinetobacter]|uniref:hypothetical protein n=1 Tax=unclassified Acinetobacter TaxID=196816 RepID=UPI0015D2806C|nr:MULTISPECIES: hypothetical protein [unclassified Acinetobacter]
MPTVSFSSLQSKTHPTLRRITNLEILKFQFELTYPLLFEKLLHSEELIVERIKRFLEIPNHFSIEPEAEGLRSELISNVISDLKLIDVCFGYFQTSFLNTSEEKLTMSGINFQKFTIFLESLSDIFTDILECANTYGIDYYYFSSTYSISDLISHNDLDSLIRDTFDIQYYINFLKNTDDENQLSQQRIEQISYLKQSLLYKYHVPNTLNTSTSFIEVKNISQVFNDEEIRNDYISLNLRLNEEPSNLPDIFVSFLIQYLENRMFLDRYIAEHSEDTFKNVLRNENIIRRFLNDLDSIENASSDNDRILSQLYSLIGIKYYRCKNINPEYSLDDHLIDLKELLERSSESEVWNNLKNDFSKKSITDKLSKFMQPYKCDLKRNARTINQLTCLTNDHLLIKEFNRQALDKNLLDFKIKYLDLNKIRMAFQ